MSLGLIATGPYTHRADGFACSWWQVLYVLGLISEYNYCVIINPLSVTGDKVPKWKFALLSCSY